MIKLRFLARHKHQPFNSCENIIENVFLNILLIKTSFETCLIHSFIQNAKQLKILRHFIGAWRLISSLYIISFEHVADCYDA